VEFCWLFLLFFELYDGKKGKVPQNAWALVAQNSLSMAVLLQLLYYFCFFNEASICPN
jgi:hypothetical protein